MAVAVVVVGVVGVGEEGVAQVGIQQQPGCNFMKDLNKFEEEIPQARVEGS